jgi:RNA polymerase sigma-70 factor (ECF subfamily)
MERETDMLLMQRCLEGDDDAFAGIVDRYKDSLVNYLTHLVRSRERAEEVAQDAFVRLYRNVANYRERERVGPCLFRIATNLVVSEARREKRWSLLLPRLRASAPRCEPAPDAHLLTTEIQQKVAAALERLPLKYRAPLVLFEIEEWSYEEIGSALALRIGTVKSRISRARRLLRSHLAPWWTGGEAHERERGGQLAAPAAAREGVGRIHV